MSAKAKAGKLLVLADESGNLLAVLYDALREGDAPAGVGLTPLEGQILREVATPDEWVFTGSAQDFHGYRLQLDGTSAELVRR